MHPSCRHSVFLIGTHTLLGQQSSRSKNKGEKPPYIVGGYMTFVIGNVVILGEQRCHSSFVH